MIIRALSRRLDISSSFLTIKQESKAFSGYGIQWLWSVSVLFHLSAEAVLVLSHHLWSHEGRRPRRARQEGVRPLELVAHSEVCDFDVTIVPQQQVGGFDVPVDDLVIVHWTRQRRQRVE